MTRYLRLYLYFLRFSFSKAMEFRWDFYFRIFMDLFYYGVNIGFFKVIYLHTNMLGGWSEAEMMVFIAAFLLIDALNMTIFANNMWMIPFAINKGELDYYLIRPVSALFIMSVRDFAASSFLNLIMVCGIMIWALSGIAQTLTFQSVTLFFLLLINGLFLRYLVRMLFTIPVFWTHSGHGLEAIFFALQRFMERPDAIFHGITRIILTTIVPFSLIASFPSRVLLEPLSLVMLLHITLVTTGFFLLILFLWNKGLRAYSSASS